MATYDYIGFYYERPSLGWLHNAVVILVVKEWGHYPEKLFPILKKEIEQFSGKIKTLTLGEYKEDRDSTVRDKSIERLSSSVMKLFDRFGYVKNMAQGIDNFYAIYPWGCDCYSLYPDGRNFKLLFSTAEDEEDEEDSEI